MGEHGWVIIGRLWFLGFAYEFGGWIYFHCQILLLII